MLTLFPASAARQLGRGDDDPGSLHPAGGRAQRQGAEAAHLAELHGPCQRRSVHGVPCWVSVASLHTAAGSGDGFPA